MKLLALKKRRGQVRLRRFRVDEAATPNQLQLFRFGLEFQAKVEKTTGAKPAASFLEIKKHLVN